MNPNDQPWTPKPYEPQSPNDDAHAEPKQPSTTPTPPTSPHETDGAEFVWERPHEGPKPPTPTYPHVHPQHPAAPPAAAPAPATSTMPAAPMIPSPTQAEALNPELDVPETARPIHQPPASTFFQPHVSKIEPQQQWTPPQPQGSYANGAQPLGPTQQYGGKMAELPAVSPGTLTETDRKQRKIFWIIVAALVILPALGIGTYLVTKLSHDSAQKKAAQQQKISYNTEALQALGKAPLTDSAVAALNKDTTLYTLLKQSAVKPVVQTKWDVFYTAQQADQRSDQYTMYDTAIDYRTKKYSYNENAYSNLGVYQVRCIGADQYNYNDSKLTTSPSWQPASDSTDCKLDTVTMHLNDGMNAGGLTDQQADSFLMSLQKSHALAVNSLSVATNKDKQYLKVDFTVTPQKQGSIYEGMQLFMNAFQTTGLNASKHPYTFFGAGGEGAHVQYFVDPATLLPVYARMDSTPILGATGQPQLTTNWSHRLIEYSFPDAVTDQNLDSHTPITFSAWPDH